MARKRKAARPYRSKFEERLGASLDAKGVRFGYETETFQIVVPVKGVRCVDCLGKRVVRGTRYTPDFFLPNWIIEAKGRFTGNDRKRVLGLLEAFAVDHEKRRFGLLFMRDNKLSKTSKTYYSDWCREKGIEFAIGEFPKGWLK